MKLSLIAGLCCLLPVAINATPHDYGDGLPPLSPSRVLLNNQGQHTHWNGIGRLTSTFGQTCTATLLDTRSPDSPTEAPAYVLTSGHCMEKRNGMIVTDHPVEGAIAFNYFADSTPRSYPLKQVNWSSMQGVDLAIVQLQASLQTLLDDGIQPIRLASEVPDNGAQILVVSAPWRLDSGHLRLAACTQHTSGVVMEQPWVWRHTVRNECQDIEEGSSGSPVLNRDTNTVFAVLNYTNRAPRQAPGRSPAPDRPTGFPLQVADSNYGNPVTLLNPCFVAGALITDPARCGLYPTFSITPEAPFSRYAKISLDADGNQVHPEWNLHFSVDKAFYRYKKAAHAMQCEDPNDYSPAITAQGASITERVDGRIGINWMCVVGVSSAEEQPEPGLMRNALSTAIELKAAGPTPAPQFSVRKSPAGSYLSHVLDWRLIPGEIEHYTFKVGPPQSTDCTAPSGFKRVFNNPMRVPTRLLPMKVCTYAHDVNGQTSRVREDTLD